VLQIKINTHAAHYRASAADAAGTGWLTARKGGNYVKNNTNIKHKVYISIYE